MKYDKELKEIVRKQAKDQRVFFYAHTAPEAYLQQELRILHALIEENEIDIKIYCSGLK